MVGTVLIYMNRKLFLRAIVAHHEILNLFKGHLSRSFLSGSISTSTVDEFQETAERKMVNVFFMLLL